MAVIPGTTYGDQAHPAVDRTVCMRSRGVLAAAGTVLLPRNCPMAFNSSTGFWVPLAHGGANGTGVVRAFLWPESFQLTAAGEHPIVVLWEGEINFGDVNTAAIQLACGGISEANLIANMKAATSDLRALGIIIEGLPGIS